MENWVHINELSGQGNKELIVTVDPNNSSKERQTQITGRTLNGITDILTIIQKANLMNSYVIKLTGPTSSLTVSGVYKNGDIMDEETFFRELESVIYSSNPTLPDVYVIGPGDLLIAPEGESTYIAKCSSITTNQFDHYGMSYAYLRALWDYNHILDIAYQPGGFDVYIRNISAQG